MEIELPKLTNSRLKSFRACTRKHYLSYTLGYRCVTESEALSFGTAIHHALEAYWLARMAEDPDRLAPALRAIEYVNDPYQRAKARVMVIGYAAAWDGLAIDEVIGVELTFSMPLINPETNAKSRTWQLAGKLDVLVRLTDGRIAIIEHKTTSEDAEAGSTYRQRLTLDGQVSQYFDGADSLATAHGFTQTDVVIYDVLVKPSQRPLLATPIENREYTKEKSRACAVCKKKSAPPAPHFDEESGRYCAEGRVVTDPGGRLYANMRDRDETPDEYELRVAEAIAADPPSYYQRVEVVRLETERDEYAFDVWQLAEAIRTSERTGKAPRNPDSCHRFGTPCEFWDVCTGSASLEDPARFRRIDPSNPHEELSSPRTAA